MITPILADDLSWEQMGILAAIVGAGMAVAIYFSVTRVRISPQPLDVQIIDQLVSKKEFHDRNIWVDGMLANREKKMDEELDKIREIIRKEIPAMERRINESGEQRIRRLHRRIDPLAMGVAGLCAKQGIKLGHAIVDGED